MSKCFLFDVCNHKDCDKEFCIRKYKMDSLYSAALITDSQKQHISLKIDPDGTDLAEFQQLVEIEKNIETFIKEGKNLYLHSSNCGNGKSSWSLRLAEAYLNKIWARSKVECRVLFISVPRFLLALKDNISAKSTYVEYIKENVLKADLVIWDDIAAKMGSEFELTHLLNIIDNRIALNKSNIYTSNLNRQQLYTALGERLTSRIANMSIDIELHGADKRFLKLEDNQG
jgi:DNA replication protein DnaC